MSPPPRILLLQLEFSTWERARPLAYCTSFGVEEGLVAAGVECVVVPAFADVPPDDAGSWLRHVPSLFAGERFDQVWLWLPHNQFGPALLEWLAGAAPARVGLLVESAQISPEELAEYPWLAGREALVRALARSLTHVAAIDERDVPLFRDELGLGASHWPAAVPARAIVDRPRPPDDPRAAFVGSLYGARAALLDELAARERLVRGRFAEEGTPLPAAFDALNARVVQTLRARGPSRTLLAEHVTALRALRRRSLDLYLGRIQDYAASVSLPTLVKAYSPRVVESIAAGRPVIAWEVPDRPANRALFTDGSELVLFRTAAELAAALPRVLDDRAFRDGLVARGQARLRVEHTVERRARDLLRDISA